MVTAWKITSRSFATKADREWSRGSQENVDNRRAFWVLFPTGETVAPACVAVGPAEE